MVTPHKTLHPSGKRSWIGILQVLGTLAVLVVIWRNIHPADLYRSFLNFSAWQIVLLWMMSGLGTVMAAYRWFCWIRDVQPAMSLRRDLPQQMRGYLHSWILASVLPSTYVSDLVRGVQSTRRGISTTVTVAGLILERALGLCALFLLCAVSGAVLGQSLTLQFAIVASLMMLGSTALMYAVFVCPRTNLKFLRWRRWQPFKGGIPKFKSSTFLKISAANLIFQATALISFHICRAAFDGKSSFWANSFVSTLTSVGALMPVSIGGFGVREFIQVAFRDLIHLSVSQAISLGVMVYTVNLFFLLLTLFLLELALRCLQSKPS